MGIWWSAQNIILSGTIKERGRKDRYSFTGKEKDNATDFYYFEARYYNPGYRHFTQADVIVPKYYDPQSLNRYAYVSNNPMKYIDPTGNGEEEPNKIKELYCTIHKNRPTNIKPEGKLKLIEKNKYIDEKNRIWYLEPDERNISHQRMLGIYEEDAKKMVEEGKPLPNKKFISPAENGISSYEAISKNLRVEETESGTFLYGEWYDDASNGGPDGGPSYNYFQPSGNFGSKNFGSEIPVKENLKIILRHPFDSFNDLDHYIFDMKPYDICKPEN
ncbi:MAG: RHS repeat-associated core domain-containing protein [Desulfobacterales bacterium]